MVKISQLNEVSNLFAGHPFRSAVVESKNGSYKLVQIGDLSQSGSVVNSDQLVEVDFTPSKSTTVIKKGDILIATRASSIDGFRSVVFNSAEENVIASGSIIIIRPNLELVSPEYLCAYLNSFQGQSDLSKNLSGSAIKIILKSSLKNIRVPIPSLQKQEFFKNLYENLEQQNKLNARKALIHQNIQNAALYTITNVN